MTAYLGVLAAAALTTLVAGCVAAALAVFGGQALPLAAGHDLTTAPGTSLAASGPASADQLSADGQQLRRLIAAALPGTPLGFYQARWSDPLGLVPGALPAAPRSAGPGNIPILEAAALGGIAGHAVLVAGTWPPAQASAPTATGPPAPAALPASAATLLHVTVGDTLTFQDRVSGTSARFRVVGLFARRPATGSAVRAGDPFWGLDTIPAAGYSTLGGFATYGPLVVDGGAFGSVLPVYRGSWLAQPDLALLPDGQFGATAGRLDDLQQSLSSSATLGGMTITTSLPTVLRDIAQGLAVARSLLVISALQLLLLAAAALLATSRLLVSQREGESALLAARGADRWQLARLTAAEVVPLALVTALAGGLAGTWLATALTRSGPLREAGLRLPGLRGGSGTDALVAVAVVALCAIGALLGPAISAGTGTARPGAALAGGGRQAAAAGLTRAGADIGLVLLAVAAGWELHRYSAVSSIAGTGGTAGLDPVLALAPALALAGGTVVMLRLLPGAARLADRLAGQARGLTAALAGWQFSRQPLRSGGAALLIVMAVATGTLALAQHESWDRSVADQAAFTAGASTRLDLPLPLPAGQAASVAGRAPAMAVSVQTQAVPALLAVQASQGARVASLRADEAASPAALFGAITPRDTPGSVLPGQPASIRLTATLAAPGLAGAARAAPGVTVTWPAVPAVTLAVLDASGVAYQLPAGTLPPDGRPHVLVAPLGGTHASYPLRLIAIDVAYGLPGFANQDAALTIAGASLAGWSARGASADLDNLSGSGGLYGGSSGPNAASWHPAAEKSTLAFSTGFGRGRVNSVTPVPAPSPLTGVVELSAAAPGGPLPAIATQAYVDSSNTRVGGTVDAVLDGLQVPVRIVAVVPRFPTITGPALVIDLPAADEVLTVAGAQPLPVTQWWLSGPPPAAPPPGTAVTTTAGIQAQLTNEPLLAAPQQALLALAAAAALLAITGFCVSIATGVRARRGENALLAALGVTQRSAAAHLCLEKLLLSVASAVLGLLLGWAVAWLLVPAVTLTGNATTPVPPPLTLLNVPAAVALAAIVAIAPVLVAGIAMIRRPDPAAELRASQA